MSGYISTLCLGIHEQSIYIQKFEFDFPAEKYIVLQKPRNTREKSKTYRVYLLYRYRGPHSVPLRYYIGRFSIEVSAYYIGTATVLRNPYGTLPPYYIDTVTI